MKILSELARGVTRGVLLGAVLGFAATAALAQGPVSIVNSRHNLSLSSPGDVHATAETDICIFCHTPHGATTDGPLWNHKMSTATYKPYSSPTLKAVVGQPNGSSRLCLSCHDGTVALGLVGSRPGGILMNNATPTGLNNVGIDLSGDHPVSFTYDATLAAAKGSLRDPSALPPEVTLDRNGQLQCTSCHDPHNAQYGNFLVMDNTGSKLCVSCHVMSAWAASTHAVSGKLLPVALAGQLQPKAAGVKSKTAAPAVSVAHTACASCHVPHAAGNRDNLMRFSAPEKNCIDCHAGDGPGKNVAAELKKPSAHPISTDQSAHNSREDLVNPPVRHVTCADCHNPHATSSAPGGKNQVSGALAAVSGVSAGGGILSAVTQEYELCFRCHGDSAARGPARVSRQIPQTNTRLEFSPGNTSFHPVESTGKNSSVPSLIPPLTASSLIGCGDCHNSDQNPAAGGSGVNGPHGSAYSPLLERQLRLTDGTPYNPSDFALCYKCHSSIVVDSEQASSWRYHRKHIEEFKAACTTCHDSHGATQPHLINFNTVYVQPNNGVLNYTSTGPNHGTCTLTCHDGSGQNKPHAAKSY
ncbi:MAG: cytochrome c3 family protein [Verrucomicrobiota bacterium]